MKRKIQNSASISEILRDQRNVALLRLLSEDSRMGVSELARRVGLSAPAVRERLVKIEQEKVIAGYRLLIDPAALGYPISAYIRVRPAPGQLNRVIELAKATPQVVECHRVTGEDCLIVKIHLPSLDALDEILDSFLVFGQTTTSLVQSTPVPLRALPVPEGNLSATVAKQAERGPGARAKTRRAI
jgi:Lrp/AsnC family transcriptional regulator, leucine-responsive regulatory protein